MCYGCLNTNNIVKKKKKFFKENTFSFKERNGFRTRKYEFKISKKF